MCLYEAPVLLTRSLFLTSLVCHISQGSVEPKKKFSCDIFVVPHKHRGSIESKTESTSDTYTSDTTSDTSGVPHGPGAIFPELVLYGAI